MMDSIESLVNQVLKEDSWNKDDKLKLLKEWEDRWTMKMDNEIQSGDQMRNNLASLKMIKSGIRSL